MTTTINASPTNGLVQTADGSGVLKVQSNGVTTNALAWVNFNGTGTVAIRSSYNVSSITDNGTGDYTVNFATALSDANYAYGVTSNDRGATSARFITCCIDPVLTTSTLRFSLAGTANGGSFAINPSDSDFVLVTIFGN